MISQHARLLIGGLDKPVACAAMLGTFAEREHIRMTGPQLIVDHDAAVDWHTGIFRQRDVRPDACGEDHGVGGDHPPIRQFDALRRVFAEDLLGVGAKENLNTLVLHQPLQQRRCRRIELPLHQAVHQMQQRHFGAGLSEAIGGFKAEQSAADHHDALFLTREFQQQIDVSAVTERMDARQVRAGDVEPNGGRAGGDDNLRERNGCAVRQMDRAVIQIDGIGRATISQRHATVAPP